MNVDSPIEISVAIPVYGAARCLRELYERTARSLDALGVSWELILVEDRSPDESWAIAKDIATGDQRVKAYRMSRNFGQHAAITAALSRSVGKWVVVMDCDLQDRPEDIAALYEEASRGFDIVRAHRKTVAQSLWRRLASRVYFSILRATSGTDLNGDFGTFSIISRRVVNEFLRIRDVHRQYLLVLDWLGFDSSSVAVDRDERHPDAGGSSYSLRTLLREAISGMLFQTTVMLRWFVYLGFLLAFCGLAGVVWLIYTSSTNNLLQGWSSTIAVILVVGGCILICVGITALYLGRVFEQVKDRPLFVLGDEVASEAHHGRKNLVGSAD